MRLPPKRLRQGFTRGSLRALRLSIPTGLPRWRCGSNKESLAFVKENWAGPTDKVRVERQAGRSLVTTSVPADGKGCSLGGSTAPRAGVVPILIRFASVGIGFGVCSVPPVLIEGGHGYEADAYPVPRGEDNRGNVRKGLSRMPTASTMAGCTIRLDAPQMTRPTFTVPPTRAVSSSVWAPRSIQEDSKASE